jgi:voltage-gated potassium channel Kch
MKRAQAQPAHPPAPADPDLSADALTAAEYGLGGTAALIKRYAETVRRGQIDIRSSRGSWWGNWAWVGGTVALLTAYGLAVGYGGEHNSLGRRFANGLGILGFSSSGTPTSWQYVLAVDLAHLVVAFAGLSVLFALFSGRLTEVRARLRSGHAVICGVGETGLRSVRALKAAGYRVTCLDTDVGLDTACDAREAGALVLHRNATHVPALENARVDRAAYVVCTGPDDAINTRVASLVVGLAHARIGDRAPSIHVHVNDPDLAQILRGPLASVGAARLHFFNVASVWARAILDDPAGPFAKLDARAPRIVVLGSTNLATAVVIGAARRWHEHSRDTGAEARLSITLVSPAAGDVCLAIGGRYPAIGRVCDLVPLAITPSAATPLDVAMFSGNGGVASGEALSAVYACLDDASANLALALEVERQVGDETPVFVPANAAAAALGPLLLGVGRIRPIVLPEDVEVLHDHMRELLAQQVHKAYLETRRDQADFGTRPADRPWAQLDQDGRRSSRAHVDGVIEQLRAAWYDIELLYDWDEQPEELSSVAIEAMAELEHLRWSRERVAAGWEYGVTRDTSRKRQELLVPWADLPEKARAIDRELVRERPQLLARAGFRLERDPAREALARHLHQRYAENQARNEERPPLAIPWNQLPEPVREANRATVDDIAVKLARIGRCAAPAIVARTADVSFTDDEIEQLGKLEHERWMSERAGAGWSLGPRDDEARTHPSFVQWEELPEQEREKDRAVVREIPNLLAMIGYTIVGVTKG